MLDLPAAGALRQNRVACSRIPVFGKSGRRNVDKQLTAPGAHERQVQVPECNRRRGFVPDQTLKVFIARVGPNVLVVIERVRVNDEQLPLTLAKSQLLRQIAQPPDKFLTELLALPLRLLQISLVHDLFRRRIANEPVGISSHAPCADFRQPLQDPFGLWTIEAVITGTDDNVRTALILQIGEAGIKCEQVAVNIGEDRNAHCERPLVALQREN